MKLPLILLLSIAFFAAGEPDSWTAEELDTANTAQHTNYLSDIEKEAFQYLNLARLYPQKFLKLELNTYKGPEGYLEVPKNDPYRKSLERELKRLKPLNVIVPDSALFLTAKCLVEEQGPTRRTGHTRVRCEKDYYGECVSYGMHTGKEIVLQLLIDQNIKNLGHRKLCLSQRFTIAGVSYGSHKKWETMAVIDFK